MRLRSIMIAGGAFMYQVDSKLTTDADFDNAVWFGQQVELWHRGEIVHPGGVIECHNPYSVKIAGTVYFKYAYDFRVR